MNCNVANVSNIPDKLSEVMENTMHCMEELEIQEIDVPQEGCEMLCGFFQLMNLKILT